MSSVLLAIVLLIIVFVIYNNFIINDFDNEVFTIRLNTLREYLRGVGGNNTVPPTLGYVSHVDNNHYRLTFFDTINLKTVKEDTYNEEERVFDFGNQSLVEVNNNPQAASVSFVAEDERMFIAHTDDGAVLMDCQDGVFDGVQCLTTPVCDRPDINLPLTEDRLNQLVFNRLASRARPQLDNNSTYHPTIYVHCDKEQTPQLEECLNGEVFQGTRCVYDPVVTTNGGGLVSFKYKTNIIKKTKFKVNVHKPHLMFPVNYSYPFDAAPCLDHEPGYTFTSNRLATTQFFECLDNNNLFLHTCNNVLFQSGRHYCDEERDCAQFEDGTGVLINTIHNDNITFDTGKSVCEKYRIKEVVECDTGDFIADKKFSHPLNVTFDLRLPRQVFYEDTCTEYGYDRVVITNDSFTVKVDNFPELSTHMVGRVSKIINEQDYLKENSVSEFVTYSRDVNEICMDPKLFTSLDCNKETGIVVDLFENTKYNVCKDGVLIEAGVVLNDDEYVEKNEVKKLIGYKGQCRYKDNDRYFDNINRVVDGYTCFFTIPSVLN
ncbi:VP91 [Diatraea saccharalis granulovirus]|uniref:VP91 n=1 Tax=Diatraea saccharalis granulovirus TaxID=1675862 RepID=A0A0R7EYP1_9BBAC|nr:VP91 [Diatraea saccharalis granulovirus]AKN80709.1 VP91 [Diatraea saccharalis granulovirus]